MKLCSMAASLWICASIAQAEDLPAYLVADPGALAVTEQNVFEGERFWPYQVGMVQAWKPEGSEKALASGSVGVLIRLEDPQHARIDFGGDGLYSVPIAFTDLVTRANRIRLGELQKVAPNFTYALGSRLVDSVSEPMRPFRFNEATGKRGYLTVFAELEQLPSLAPALAPLASRSDVLTLVLPQGRIPDERVRNTLRGLGWKAPFVWDHLAEAYTPSLLPADVAMPAVMLQTAEGRVVFQAHWGPEVSARLHAALEANFP